MTRRALPLLLALAVLAGWGVSGLATGVPTPAKRSLARERAAPPEPGSPIVVILCYHDLSDAPGRKDYTIPPEEFRRHLRRLRESGWTFLSLSELIARRDRPEGLPGKTVVITFDDAYRSFSEKALPILMEEKVKATLAVVSSFIDNGPAPDMPPLMTWRQIREAAESGFVEVASHTHDLHRYVVSNPYNDTAPAVIARRYLNPEKRYEDRDEYRKRIRADLRKSRAVLVKKLGHDVPVLAWPYGEYNAMADGVAREEGFSVTLGVEETDVRREDFSRGHFPRIMVVRGMAVGGKGTAWIYPVRPPVRAAQADLDAVYHPDPAIFRARVDRLVAKVRAGTLAAVDPEVVPHPPDGGERRQQRDREDYQDGQRGLRKGGVPNNLPPPYEEERPACQHDQDVHRVPEGEALLPMPTGSRPRLARQLCDLSHSPAVPTPRPVHAAQRHPGFHFGRRLQFLL